DSAEISGNVILGNLASLTGFSGRGGIAIVGATSVSVVNNTIVWNFAGVPGAGIDSDTASVTIENNVVAFCSSGIHGPQGMTVKNNCVFGNPLSGTPNNYFGIPDPTGVDGNISVDPQLANAPFASLSPSSPCRDAGDNTATQSDWLDIKG